MNQSRPAGLPFPAPRRHSTVPTSFQPSQGRPSSDPVTTNGSVETLYSHPAVKIVAFTAGRSFFNAGPGVDEKPGTLASSSQFERTIAVGTSRCQCLHFRMPTNVCPQVHSRFTEPPDPLPFSAAVQPSNRYYPRANAGV